MDPRGASSPQLLRRLNAGAVVRFALGVGEFAAAEAMSATGLTWPTVLGVCDGLVADGWLEEVADSRAAGLTSKGRPARRYRLREAAGVVAGLDAGQHHFTAVVADLRGRVLAQLAVDAPPVDDVADMPQRRRAAGARRALAASLLREALAAAGRSEGDALIAAVAVPAPVDARGLSPRGEDDYWATMNPGFAGALPCEVVVENDANLAAVAEQARGGHPSEAGVATVLAGERLGAGVILDGRLLRGSRGGVGEMRFLGIVEGVGTAEGVGALARDWGREELGDGVDVFAAAAEGDPSALAIVDRLGDRVARVAEALSSLLDIDRVVFAGAIAPALGPVLARAREVMRSEFQDPVPELAASALGPDIVAMGAVDAALARVRAEPLAFAPRRTSEISPTRT